jgi:hypothetical protein
VNPNYAPDFRGWVALVKTDGLAEPANGTQTLIPATEAWPRNPLNRSRPGVINAAAYPSVEVPGKRTPSVRIATLAKPTWFTAGLLNSLINSLNAANGTYQTDGYAVGLCNVFETRVYDVCRCERIVIGQKTAGAPIDVTLDFRCIYGDSEAPSPTEFRTPSTDAGQLIGVSAIDWAGTADQVQSWKLTLSRVQRWIAYEDGTLYCAEVASGGFSASLVLVQSPTYNVSPTTAATLNLGSTGAGVGFSMLLSGDGDAQPQTLEFGRKQRTYTAIDLSAGGNPVTISAL